ncbi:MAG: hypothetical protein WAM60_23100 [Candidatus Promineifilaceae bacterium]
MNEKQESTMSIIAAILVLFTALLSPLVAALSAVMGLLGFAIVSAGKGISILLWKIVGLRFRLLHPTPRLWLISRRPIQPLTFHTCK